MLLTVKKMVRIYIYPKALKPFEFNKCEHFRTIFECFVLGDFVILFIKNNPRHIFVPVLNGGPRFPTSYVMFFFVFSEFS